MCVEPKGPVCEHKLPGKSATIKETDMWSYSNCNNEFVQQESGITLIRPILWGPSSFLSLRLCLFKVIDDILYCFVMDEVPAKSSKPLSMSLPRTLTQQQLPYYKMKLSPQVLSQTTHIPSLSPLHYSCMKSDDSLKMCVSAGLLRGGPATEKDHISAGESTSPSSALPREDYGQFESSDGHFPNTASLSFTNVLYRNHSMYQSIAYVCIGILPSKVT